MTKKIIESAGEFRSAGFKIFPIHQFKGGKCMCGDSNCQAAGKHPAIKKWNTVPVWSDEQFDCMAESGEFDYGFGVLTENLLIVDIDKRNDGDENDLPDDLSAYSGMRVASGSGDGSTHDYFKLPDNIAISKQVAMYKGIDFISSGNCFVVGPGSNHKSGQSYNIVWGSINEIEEAPKWLIDICRKTNKIRVYDEERGHIDITDKEIKDCVFAIGNVDDRQSWLEVGMGIHNTIGQDGYELWANWSAQSSKYDPDVQLKIWHSFGDHSNPITFATLKHKASEDGWIEPVTFDIDEFDDDVPMPSFDSDDCNELPFDVSDMDMLKPPGFIGDLTDWINSQCLYPREYLAVATALSVVGDIAGLRCILDDHRTKSNLITFCIAGSSTGKEDVLQARIKLLTAAGIPQIQHGRWKSEQEIIRNLIRNAQSSYVVDELGIQLKKIQNASKSGSTPYLEGIIGEVMSLFSKSYGIYTLSGDLKEEIKNDINTQIKIINKRAESGDLSDDDATRLINALNKSKDEINQGLIHPFLSVLGFTTPQTFESVISYDNLTNGFLARAILVDEVDTNPKMRQYVKKPDLPNKIKAAISTLHSSGTYEVNFDKKIERFNDLSIIPSSGTAKNMILSIIDWQHARAEQEKENTGYDAVWRRLTELTNKISLILAIPSGLRTGDHVRWAFEYCRGICQRKIELALSKGDLASADHSEGDKLMNKILSLLNKDKPETTGTIVNRCRKYQKNDVITALGIMVKKSMIEVDESLHPKKKTKILRYKKIS